MLGCFYHLDTHNVWQLQLFTTLNYEEFTNLSVFCISTGPDQFMTNGDKNKMYLKPDLDSRKAAVGLYKDILF